MIEEITVENFKSLKNQTSIELKSINIFCGANSSGKSSILQTILLITQSFSSRFNYDSVILNGNLLRLGSMKDILSRSPLKKEITLSLKLKNLYSKTYGNYSSIYYKYSFSTDKTKNQDDDYNPSITEILFNSIQEAKDPSGKSIKSNNSILCTRFSTTNEKTLSVNNYFSPSLTNSLKLYPDSEVSRVINNSLAPYSFEIRFNKSKNIFRLMVEDFKKDKYININSGNIDSIELSKEIYPVFMDKIDDLISLQNKEKIESIRKSKDLSSFIEKRLKKTNIIDKNKFWNDLLKHEISIFPNFSKFASERITPLKVIDFIEICNSLSEEKRERLANLLSNNKLQFENYWLNSSDYVYSDLQINSIDLSNTSGALTNYFNNSLKYLGPLRSEPQAVYSSIGQPDPKNVGLKGEFTAAALHLNKNNRIKYLKPNIIEDKIEFEPCESTLAFACQVWLKYLGVISEYSTKDKGKLGYELLVKIDPEDEWHDLTHVGVGVSQILPIVLLSLLSNEGDTLIFEQPELHLHPKIQSRLLDLFYALSESGRQCIIETHSEYFIHRLRLRIAQANDNRLNENSKIYFIDKEKESSLIKSININEYGSILKWPKDFFDQTDSEIERILIEASRKKKNKKEEAIK
ncbi:DUF3696 domain-containing protein [Comamonas resistens]|uniref:DUF3696 domain-containing protein n=1 Tax=Comamonas resistens TaxID=3046670 RepID=A0ABY8SXD0_9BURK|nr:DUF3696 domain-containing protein [Comamonas resistens]MDL5038891.1 DUF3696 domain-containing protein [Comamonas resistens]WHS67707.1 DUF3696 domain-containing protein [Comamonas resistens]